jgi:hypothetical protein
MSSATERMHRNVQFTVARQRSRSCSPLAMLSMPPPDQFPAMTRNGDITADCAGAAAKLKPIIKTPKLI